MVSWSRGRVVAWSGGWGDEADALSEIGQHILVFGFVFQVEQRRGVPGAAHNGDVAEAFALGGADVRPHGGFTRQVERGGGVRLFCGCAQCAHQFQNACKDVAACFAAVFDETFPPVFAIGATALRGQQAEQVFGWSGWQGCLLGPGFSDRWLLPGAQLAGLFQVYPAHRHAAGKRPADGLPFEGEFGQGVKGRLLRGFSR